MKYFAIAALVGLISAAEVESEFSRFQGRRLNTYVQQQAEGCTDSSDSSCDDDEAEDVQTGDFPAYMDGFGGYKTYIRDVPDRFETEADDTLMKSLYATYAVEGEDKDGLPNGRYWVTKENAMKAADEVVDTHLRLHKGEKADYLAANFPALWARFDVNEEGKVEIDRMPQLLRSICGNSEACLGL